MTPQEIQKQEEKCFKAVNKIMEKNNCVFRVIREFNSDQSFDIITYKVTAVHKENLPKKEEIQKTLEEK